MRTTSVRNSAPDQHACDNCGAVWTVSELEDVKDLGQRVDSGGVVPSGECPDCGALCYPVLKGKHRKSIPSKTRKAMKKALRALNVIREDQSSGPERMILKAIAALEEALALKQS